MSTFDKSSTTEGAAQQFFVEGNQCPVHQNVTIETLPDDVLLEIFACYLYLDRLEEINATDVWHTLVHVCHRWRYLVFAYPGHLNLRLKCTTKTRAREMLGVWPPFPIVILDESDSMYGMDNIIAALEQRDRVREITLEHIPGSKMDAYVPAMLGPFPALDGIIFWADDSGMAVVPDLFLGGSAPQLQCLTFCAIPFPTLPTLLSSTINLESLDLTSIPRSGYISPEVLVTCLSAMPRLETLCLQFDSPQSFPNRESRPHPPVARCTLPALRELAFDGVNDYFEDLMARIDTPVIRCLEIAFFHRHFYDFSQLSQFIGRVEVFKSPAHAEILFLNGLAEMTVSLRTGTDERASLLMGIICNGLHLQLRYFAQVYSSSFLRFSNVKSLAISSPHQLQHAPTAEDFLWLELLHPFSAVKVLDIDKNSLNPVAYTLQKVVKERITEMFPAIREVSTGEDLPSRPIPILRAIEEFATARGLLTRLDHPRRWVAG